MPKIGKNDFYKLNERVKRTVKRVKEAPISERNKKSIFGFQRQCVADGLSPQRVIFYLNNLRALAEWLGKDFEDATKDDIIELAQKIEQMDYKGWTKLNYKTALKRFYKWLREDDSYPEEVRWIKLSKKNLSNKVPEELLTEEDVKKLINSAYHPRDKALISVLYESGCRVGELSLLCLKHVRFDDFGAVLIVQGKTGMRRVRIVSSVAYLATWMDNHPMKEDPAAPLWVGVGTAGRDKPLDYAAIRTLLRRTAKRAGVKKKVNPHQFRHSRATHLASHLTEAQMNEYLGWVQGSEMPSTYVHLSGRDVDDSLLKMYGMKIDQKKREAAFKPKKCYRCGQTNPSTGKFCQKCGAVIDSEMGIKLENEMKELDDTLAALLQDKKVQDVLVQRMKELGMRESK